MNKKKFTLIFGTLIIVIALGSVAVMLFTNYRNAHDKDAILTAFVGEWQVSKKDELSLVVTDELASFVNNKNGIVSYEDCTYEINDKYVLELKGVGIDFTCKMGGNLKKMTCNYHDEEISLKKYAK